MIKTNDETLAPVSELSRASVHATHQPFDWFGAPPEKWDYVEADTCDECEVTIAPVHGEEQHCSFDPASNCSGWLCASGPIIDSTYPLAYDCSAEDDATVEQYAVDAAVKIVHLPLCVVEFRHPTGRHITSLALALTGCGMDLSWEICEAHMRLGHLPPLVVCDLPGLASRGHSDEDRWIIDGCLESARVAKMWAGLTYDRLQRRFPKEENYERKQ